MINGKILSASNHSLSLKNSTAFKCDNINIKTAVASQTGVGVENANDLILNNITSDVTSYAFWFRYSLTKVKMTNCKAITAAVGIFHTVDLTDSIIANNDLSQPTSKLLGTGLLTNVIFRDNIGYSPPISPPAPTPINIYTITASAGANGSNIAYRRSGG